MKRRVQFDAADQRNRTGQTKVRGSEVDRQILGPSDVEVECEIEHAIHKRDVELRRIEARLLLDALLQRFQIGSCRQVLQSRRKAAEDIELQTVQRIAQQIVQALPHDRQFRAERLGQLIVQVVHETLQLLHARRRVVQRVHQSKADQTHDRLRQREQQARGDFRVVDRSHRSAGQRADDLFLGKRVVDQPGVFDRSRGSGRCLRDLNQLEIGVADIRRRRRTHRDSSVTRHVAQRKPDFAVCGQMPEKLVGRDLLVLNPQREVRSCVRGDLLSGAGLAGVNNEGIVHHRAERSQAAVGVQVEQQRVASLR